MDRFLRPVTAQLFFSWTPFTIAPRLVTPPRPAPASYAFAGASFGPLVGRAGRRVDPLPALRYTAGETDIGYFPIAAGRIFIVVRGVIKDRPTRPELNDPLCFWSEVWTRFHKVSSFWFRFRSFIEGLEASQHLMANEWDKIIGPVFRPWLDLLELAVEQELKQTPSASSMARVERIAQALHIERQGLGDALKEYAKRDDYRERVQALLPHLEVTPDPPLQGKRRLTVDRERKRAAFAQALKELKEAGAREENQKPIRAAVATRAWGIYCRELPKDHWPKLKSFQLLTGGKKADPAVVRLLEEAGIEKRHEVKIDHEKMRWAFALAVQKLKVARAEEEGRAIHRFTVAGVALEIYCEGLPEEERPSLLTFRQAIFGRKRDPRIISLLEAAAIEKQPRAKIDREDVRQAFAKALVELRTAGAGKEPTAPSLSAIADTAWHIYCVTHPGETPPNRGTFSNYVMGRTADAALLRLIKESGLVGG